jgi:ABC-type uncharacterized transport system permease subunit
VRCRRSEDTDQGEHVVECPKESSGDGNDQELGAEFNLRACHGAALILERDRMARTNRKGGAKWVWRAPESGLANAVIPVHQSPVMDHYLLLISTVLALAGAVWGGLSVHRGLRTWWTLILIVAAFLVQILFLNLRGQMRGACPLRDIGEILVFLACSLTFFYLVVGQSYRLSLIGLFTAPVVVVFQLLALYPGVMDAAPIRSLGVDPWREAHSAVSVLAYGAFALAAVTGVMFLVLDRQLKDQHLKSGLFRNLPPVRELLAAVLRLLWIGYLLLSVGIVAGWLMPHRGGWSHLLTAVAVWLVYGLLLLVKQWRGMTGRRLAVAAVGLFVLSLGVFALL